MFDLAIMIARGCISYTLTAQLNLSDLNFCLFCRQSKGVGFIGCLGPLSIQNAKSETKIFNPR